MKKVITFSVIISCLFIGLQAHAQHDEHAAVANPHSLSGSHRLTLGLGHTHVSEGKKDGKTEWLVLPSWSLNYDYWLSNKWAIGLQNDIILESFVIETHGSELIERSFPLSVVPVAIFKPGKHISFIGGAGAEISKGQTLALTRLGVEYGFHLPNNWEVGAAMLYDGKWNYYNSWGISITVSKLWPKK